MKDVELVLYERCHEMAWQLVRLDGQLGLASMRHEYDRAHGLYEERMALRTERSDLLREIWSKRR